MARKNSLRRQEEETESKLKGAYSHLGDTRSEFLVNKFLLTIINPQVIMTIVGLGHYTGSLMSTAAQANSMCFIITFA